jgi:8-oxo-dGTP pyrophosphatase MutT (NUDIX family)
MAATAPVPTIRDGPSTEFKVAPELSEFQVPPKQYLASLNDPKLEVIGAGIIVLDGDRVLLVKRSLSDTTPGLWETPGGGCEDEDSSIIMGAARELWEEAGIHISSVIGVINRPWRFQSRSGKNVVKFNFIAEAKMLPLTTSNEERIPVILSHEHEDFVWANLEEVKAERCGNKELHFTSIEQKQIIIDTLLQCK